MQITENQVLSKKRTRDLFWCRIILCNFFKKQRRSNVEVAKLLKITNGAVTYFIKKYKDDFRYCERFRILTIEIENLKKQKIKRWRKLMLKKSRKALLKKYNF